MRVQYSQQDNGLFILPGEGSGCDNKSYIQLLKDGACDSSQASKGVGVWSRAVRKEDEISMVTRIEGDTVSNDGDTYPMKEYSRG